MRLYLVRHAEPDYAIDGLTPAGHLEAQALAKRMLQIKPDALYVSPLGRAQATANYTAQVLGLTPTIEPWLTERSSWRIDQSRIGRDCVWDIHGQTVRAMTPAPTKANWHEYPPLNEPAFRQGFDELCQSSDEFMARHGFVRQEAGGTKGGYQVTQPENRRRIALFCHGGFGLTWLAHLLEIPLPLMWAGFFLCPSSVTTILMDEREPGIAVPRCIGLADVSHLYEAGLPVSTSGIKANDQ